MAEAAATIHSFTVIRSAPPTFVDRVPYCVAVLEHPDGSRTVGLVDGYADGMAIRIGQTVQHLVGDDAPCPRYAL